MQSKNKARPNAAQQRHLARLSEFGCVICGADGVEMHEPVQGLWWLTLPLCPTCHRHPIYGWHGQKSNWKARKMDEWSALNALIGELMRTAAPPVQPLSDPTDIQLELLFDEAYRHDGHFGREFRESARAILRGNQP